MKKIILFTLWSVILFSNFVSGEKKIHYLKPGEKVITQEQMLVGLSDPDWQKNDEFLGKWSWTLHDVSYFKNDPIIKAKLIELLKKAYSFRENEMRQLKAKGAVNPSSEFDKHYYRKGFAPYLSGLTYLVWQYNDPETLPLIVKTEGIYSSDEYTLDNYLRHFGRKTFEYFLQILQEGEGREKVRVYGYLNTWMNKSLNNIQGIVESNSSLDKENELKPDEIEVIKKELIKGLTTDDSMQIHIITFGLKNIIKHARNSEEKSETKSLLKKYLNYKEDFVREAVVGFLGEIGDESDIPDLEKLNNDPGLDFHTEKVRSEEIRSAGVALTPSKYPVREMAKKAIEKIKIRHANK